MRTATVTEAKNGLSALLDQVKAGETILITDRGVPVAVIEPITTMPDAPGRLERLARAGLVRLGTGRLPDDFFERPMPTLPDGVSIVDAVLEERRSGW